MSDAHNSSAALPRGSGPLQALPSLGTGELLRIALVATWLVARRIPATAVRWHRRARQRTTLAHLDDRLLRDIGLTRQQARRECAKWFWQP